MSAVKDPARFGWLDTDVIVFDSPPEKEKSEQRDWDETQHPRGEDGKFIDKLEWYGTKPGPLAEAEVPEKMSDTDRLDAAAADILAGEAAFAAAGGRLGGPDEFPPQQRDRFMASASNAYYAINKANLTEEQREHLSLADTMITNAFWNRKHHVVAFTAQGDVAGAYGFLENADPAGDGREPGYVGSGYMGSLSTVKGAGSAMFGALVRYAAARNYWIGIDALAEAAPFWKRMGFEITPVPGHGSRDFPTEMTEDQVAYLAKQLEKGK